MKSKGMPAAATASDTWSAEWDRTAVACCSACKDILEEYGSWEVADWSGALHDHICLKHGETKPKMIPSQGFTIDERTLLVRLLMTAFSSLPRSTRIHDIPGAVYTKIRTAMPTGGRTYAMFIGNFKDLSYRLTNEQEEEYKDLYSRAYSQWTTGGKTMSTITDESMSLDAALMDLTITSQNAILTIHRARRAAEAAETITNQLEEIEQSLKGD